MKKLAFAAMFTGAFGLLVGCGGGDDDGGNADAGCIINCVDGGGGGTVDAGQAACNPVAQTGCQADEKCSQLIESDNPFLARTTCVPDGNVPNGGMCMDGTPGPTTGYDDCAAGNLCTGGTCLEICTQAPDSCPQGEACVPYADTFDDLDGVGMCNPTCDVLAQDCPQDPGDPFGTGCYVSLLTGGATCAPALPEEQDGMPGTQGIACMYLNTCAVGYGCTQLNDPVMTTGNVCAYFCDVSNSGGPTCTIQTSGSEASTCVAINGGFYGDATEVDMNIGFCVNCEVWADVPGCMPME